MRSSITDIVQRTTQVVVGGAHSSKNRWPMGLKEFSSGDYVPKDVASELATLAKA